MRDCSFAIQVLHEPTAMGDDEFVKVVQGGLCISIDMSNNATKDRRILFSLRPELRVKILQLDLLPTKVIVKSSELRPFVFFTLFMIEVV